MIRIAATLLIFLSCLAAGLSAETNVVAMIEVTDGTNRWTQPIRLESWTLVNTGEPGVYKVGKVSADEVHCGSNTLYVGSTPIGICTNSGGLCLGGYFQITPTEFRHKDMADALFKVHATSNYVDMHHNFKLKKLELESDGFTSKGRGKFSGSDVEIEDDDRGLIMAYTNGTRWVMSVQQTGPDTGQTVWTKVSSSPEVDMETRRARMTANREKNDAAKIKWDQAGNVTEKIDAIAELLGLKDPD